MKNADCFHVSFPLTPALSLGERVKLCRAFGMVDILSLYPAVRVSLAGDFENLL
jgi:hypothetical protein